MKSSSRNVSSIGFRKGFTLIELMVVITIVVVLASLAFMGFSRLKKQGYRAASMNNLRQLQAANQTYAAENNGIYVQAWSFDEDGNQNPQKWNVNEEFLGYLRGEVSPDAPTSVRRSVPEALLDPLVVRTRASRWDRLEKSYGLNITTLEGGSNNTPGSKRQIKTTQLVSPSRTFSFITGQNPFIAYSGRYTYNGTENNTGNTTTAYRHDGKAIAVFFDGHTELKSMDDMREIDDKGGSRHPFWKGFR